MVLEYIRYQIGTARRDAFLQAYTQAASHLDDSPYCLAYEMSECEEEPGVFVLRIEWTSTEEHLNGFRKSTDFPPFFALVKEYFPNIQEMRHYKLTALSRRKVHATA